MARTINTEKQDEFIVKYFECNGIKSRAAKKVGIDPTTVTRWFKDEEFLERLESMREEFHGVLYTQLYARACKKSDTAAIFLLKSMNPEMYDDAIRKLKYMKEEGISDEPPKPQVIKYVPWDTKTEESTGDKPT